VRVDGSDELTWAYQQQYEPTGQTAVERMLIVDDRDFCIDVMKRLAGETKNDDQVAALAREIVAGFREPSDLCELTGMDNPAYEAAFKRLKRRFGQALDATRKDEK
jgi:hypothetical protein